MQASAPLSVAANRLVDCKVLGVRETLGGVPSSP